MADEKRKEPTASEAMFFFAIVKHTRNKADIDWDAVAQEQGFKNSEVAKVRFGQVKRKLGIASDPATTPRKASANAPGGTPSKVKKTPTRRAGTKGKGRGGRVKKEESQEEDEEQDTPREESSPVKNSEDDEEPCKGEDGDELF